MHYTHTHVEYIITSPLRWPRSKNALFAVLLVGFLISIGLLSRHGYTCNTLTNCILWPARNYILFGIIGFDVLFTVILLYTWHMALPFIQLIYVSFTAVSKISFPISKLRLLIRHVVDFLLLLFIYFFFNDFFFLIFNFYFSNGK